MIRKLTIMFQAIDATLMCPQSAIRCSMYGNSLVFNRNTPPKGYCTIKQVMTPKNIHNLEEYFIPT